MWQFWREKLTGPVLTSKPGSFMKALAWFTVLAVVVPWYPKMPISGLDPSWMFAMNVAAARHLRIGQDLIFTFGPYASIYTETYHPFSDHLMLAGSALWGLAYAAGLMFLAKEAARWMLAAFLIFLSGFIIWRDALFFSYFLIVAVFVLKWERQKKSSVWDTLVIAFMSAPLGLLPLVKGSALFISVAILAATGVFLAAKHRVSMLLGLLLGPLMAMVFFWLLSEQTLRDLPGYFTGLSPIIAGYPGAMSVSLPGVEKDIALYLAATLLLLWCVYKIRDIDFLSKGFLALSVALVLFVAFKAGYMRHGGHSLMSVETLIMAALVAGFVGADKRFILALGLVSLVGLRINKHYIKGTFVSVGQGIYDTFTFPARGLWMRAHRGALDLAYSRSLEAISQSNPIPRFEGNVDVYSFGQSFLLASDNQWNPRPVLQSYSAYTPDLLRMDERHLRSFGSPNHILFRVEAIDERFPSLEEGLSWPAFFDNYQFMSLDENFVYLDRRSKLKASSAFKTIYEGTLKTGDLFTLPSSPGPIYAELKIKPTMLGRILSILYKPSQLHLEVNLRKGVTREYRVVAGIMETGFFISPMVKTNRDFVYLLTKNTRYLDADRVESLRLVPDSSLLPLWERAFTLKLKSYESGRFSDLPKGFFDSLSEVEPLPLSGTCDCDANIDSVDGEDPKYHKIKVSGSMPVEGWLATSFEKKIPAAAVFVTLTDGKGKTLYAKARFVPRKDTQGMQATGFTLACDVSKLKGRYSLGLARQATGQSVMQRCNVPAVPVEIY